MNKLLVNSLLLVFLAVCLRKTFAHRGTPKGGLCSRLFCKRRCPNGRRVDENGCEVCTCKGCYERKCFWDCIYSYDAKGCKSCLCRNEFTACRNVFCEEGKVCRNGGCFPDYACKNVVCEVGTRCVHGLCTTGTNLCQHLKCERGCPNGRRVDENGCEECICKGCDTLRCGRPCTYGPKYDENGCISYCSCNEKNDPCKNVFCEKGSRCVNGRCSLCPDVSCDRSCPNGRHVDENGCEECICKGCNDINCSGIRCQYDAKYDENGCQIVCSCKGEISLCGNVVCNGFVCHNGKCDLKRPLDHVGEDYIFYDK